MAGVSIPKIGHCMDSKVSKDSTTPPQKLEMHRDGRAPYFEGRLLKQGNDPFPKQNGHGSTEYFCFWLRVLECFWWCATSGRHCQRLPQTLKFQSERDQKERHQAKCTFPFTQALLNLHWRPRTVVCGWGQEVVLGRVLSRNPHPT